MIPMAHRAPTTGSLERGVSAVGSSRGPSAWPNAAGGDS
jgi:hypothetical protein